MNGSEGLTKGELLRKLEEYEMKLEDQETRISELSRNGSQMQKAMSELSSKNYSLETENQRRKDASEADRREIRRLEKRYRYSVYPSMIFGAIATGYSAWMSEVFREDVTSAAEMTAEATLTVWKLSGKLLGRIVTNVILSAVVRAAVMAVLLIGTGWLIWKLTRNMVRRQADVISAVAGMAGLMAVSVLGPMIRRVTQINLIHVWAVCMVLYGGVRTAVTEEDKEKKRKMAICTVTGGVMIGIIATILCVLMVLVNRIEY